MSYRAYEERRKCGIQRTITIINYTNQFKNPKMERKPDEVEYERRKEYLLRKATNQGAGWVDSLNNISSSR